MAKPIYATPFVNWQGIMIGNREVWFSDVDDGSVIKIIAINE